MPVVSVKDYLPTIIPWAAAAIAILYSMKVTCQSKAKESSSGGLINQSIEKENPKVTTLLDIEDLGEKTALCRCWKSKKFPYCDGAHSKHNLMCGDNVGPVVIKRNPA